MGGAQQRGGAQLVVLLAPYPLSFLPLSGHREFNLKIKVLTPPQLWESQGSKQRVKEGTLGWNMCSSFIIFLSYIDRQEFVT